MNLFASASIGGGGNETLQRQGFTEVCAFLVSVFTSSF